NPAVINTASAGTTTYTFTPDAGQCATATATMDITISASITPTFDVVDPICSGAALAALPTTSNNGITGTWAPALDNTQTTTYTFTPDPGQCATTTTLQIVVNENVRSTTQQTICATALPYTWNGQTFNAAGTYDVTLTSTAGCDSIATLVVTVNDVLTSTTEVTICETELPYTWSGQTFDAAGTYDVTLTSSAGCDSIATLVLTVYDVLTSTTNISICTSQLPYTWNGETFDARSEEHTSELQSRENLVCR